VRWQKQIILKRDALCAALEAHKVGEDEIAAGIKTLLEAKRRVVEYLPGGDRETQMVPDAAAIKNGIELWMEIVGLRRAQGFEAPDTTPDENGVAVDAIVNLTRLKLESGWSSDAIRDWLRTQDGLESVRSEMDRVLKSNADEVVDV